METFQSEDCIDTGSTTRLGPKSESAASKGRNEDLEVSSRYEWAFRELCEWHYSGTTLDELVAESLGISGDRRALRVINRWMDHWPVSHQGYGLEYDLITARGRLDPDFIADSIELAKDKGDRNRYIRASVVPTREVLEAYRYAYANECGIPSVYALALWDREFRQHLLGALARGEGWDSGRWPLGLLKYFHPQEVLNAVGPRITEIDHETAGALLRAYAFWPPGPWDGAFTKLLEIGPAPTMVQELSRHELEPIIVCEPMFNRFQRLSCAVARAALPDSSCLPLYAANLTAKLEPGRMAIEPRDLILRARRLARIPEMNGCHGIQTIGQTLRLLKSKRVNLGERWVRPLIAHSYGGGLLSIALAAGYQLEPQEVSRAFEIQRRRGYPLEFEPGGERVRRQHDQDWKIATILARGARRPDALGELRAEDLSGGPADLFDELFTNELWRIQPGISDWLQHASPLDALAIHARLADVYREWCSRNPFPRSSMKPAGIARLLLPVITEDLRLMECLSAGTHRMDESLECLERNPQPSLVAEAANHFEKILRGGHLNRLRQSRELPLRTLAAVCVLRHYALTHNPNARFVLKLPHAPNTSCRPRGRYVRIRSGSITVSRFEIVHERIDSAQGLGLQLPVPLGE